MRWLLLTLSIVTSQLLIAAPRSSQAAEAPNSAKGEIVSFLNDVEPVLTRFGCNSGGCHGKLAGQNGFRLSLRGFAPEQDFQWLAREAQSRRVNLFHPADSLLLKKATAEVPHGGGKRIEKNTPGYRVLLNWIEQGGSGPIAQERRLARIEVTPSRLSFSTPGDVALQVWAHYSDGSQRDVTWMTRFQANNRNVADVSPEGIVSARIPGETVVVAGFDGLVEPVVVSVPHSRQMNDAQFVAQQTVVDGPVLAKLKQLRIPIAPPCDDATFIRRAMLDTLGVLPTADETREFLADTRSNKRELLVERLLERPEFVDFWTLQWSDLFQNRKERDHDVRGTKGVRGFQSWLREQVKENRAWDDLVKQLLLAEGDSSTHPEIGYFVVTVGEQSADRSEVGDSVAQAILGTRIGCARCHNHPLERYTQDDYYHFIAFFSRVVLDRKEPKDGPTRLVKGTQQTLQLERQLKQERQQLSDAVAKQLPLDQIKQKEQQVERLQQELSRFLAAPPRVSQPRTGQSLAPRSLDRLPLATDGGAEPRELLANWLVTEGKQQFAGAIVNRLWKHFFAVGLVEPVDDLRATNPPSNQALWDKLIEEFIGHRYDLKHVMRLILNSRTYQLASATTSENASDSRFYSHYYARRLPAEVLLDAISSTTGVAESFPGYPLGTKAIQLPGPQVDSYFLSVFGRSDRVTACDCERNNDVTLPQLLHLRNGEALLAKIGSDEGHLASWLRQSTDHRHLISTLFLSILGRNPNEVELSACLANLDAATDPKEAAADLFWALMNTKEFAFNH